MTPRMKYLISPPLYFYATLFTFFCGFSSHSSANASFSKDRPDGFTMHGPSELIQSRVLHGTRKLSKRGLSTHVDNSALFSPSQVLSIQVTAIVLAGISLTASLLALFWFCRMRQKFRHRLIMLLVCADVMRSFWFFVFPVVYVARGTVLSSSKFCQASGFLSQMALEMADVAILFIAIHTALQVFKPPMTHFGIEEGGIYRYRYLVFGIFITLPPFLASLAFIRSSKEGYETTGPLCSLPVRPFWYRLAISWIPRYIIMLTVAGLYIAIYIHVAVQFRVIGWLRNTTSSSTTANETTLLSMTSAGDGTLDTISPVQGVWRHRLSSTTLGQNRSSVATEGTSQGKSRGSRKASSVAMIPDSVPEQQAIDLTDALKYSPTTPNPNQYGSITSGDGCVDNLAESRLHNLQPPSKRSHGGSSDAPNHTAETADQGKNKEMRDRHNAIQRQLKNLFIYPICYFLIWLIPFVNHLLNYSNYFAQHPVFVLTLLSYISLSSMGTVDCVVFVLRERPWRTIPGTDGTVLGSFRFWTHPIPTRSTKPRPPVQMSQHPQPSIRRPGTQSPTLDKLDILPPIPGSSGESGSVVNEGLDAPLRKDGPPSLSLETKSLGDASRAQRNRDRYWFDRATDGTEHN